MGGTRRTPLTERLDACLKSFCHLAPDEDDLKVVPRGNEHWNPKP